MNMNIPSRKSPTVLALVAPPHEKIGITKREYDLLIKVRGLLDTAKLKHSKARIFAPAHGFNMDEWVLNGRFCGTVCCIGGWMGLDEDEGFSKPLDNLFWPDLPRSVWRDITPAQAVVAIDNFIATGDPNWHSAVLS